MEAISFYDIMLRFPNRILQGDHPEHEHMTLSQSDDLSEYKVGYLFSRIQLVKTRNFPQFSTNLIFYDFCPQFNKNLNK
jgi:hypothetical protein